MLLRTQGSSQQSTRAEFRTTSPTLALGIPPPVVTAEDPGELTLEWRKPLDSGGARITGYLVRARRWLSDTASWSEQRVIYDGRSSPIKSARIQGLAANTQYGFSVVAFNYRSVCVAEELSTSGDELIVTTQDGTVPFEPKNLHAVKVTGGAVSVAWDLPLSSGGDPLLGYVVYAGIASEEFFPIAALDVSEPRTLTLFGLQTKQQYKFTVCAENVRGLGRNATILLVTTTEATTPGLPKNLQQYPSASGGAIVLLWDAPDDIGGVTLQSYLVYRNASLLATLDAVDSTTVFVDTSTVSANTVYSYAIASANSVMTGDASTTILVRSSPASVPAPPSVEVLTTRGGSIVIQWIPSSDSGGTPVRGFSIVLTSNGVTVGSYEGSLTQTEFRGLFAETEYLVIVQTRNDVGLSEIATAVMTTDVAGPPARLSTPRLVSVSGGRARLELSPPDDFGGTPITQYQFYLDSELVYPDEVSATVFDIMKLVANTNYEVTTSAVNAAGQGDVSPAIQVATASVSAPGFVQAAAVVYTSFDHIEIDWDAPRDTGGVAASSLSFDVSVGKGADTATQTLVDVAPPLLIEELDANTLYVVRVRAKNSVGVGGWSLITLVKTDPVSPGTISFLSNAASVSEGVRTLSVIVTRTNGGAMPAACTYRTLDGTATDMVHYVGVMGGLIQFSAGAKQQTLNVSIINNDVLDDPERVFYIELLAIDFKSGEVGPPNRLAVTIRDDGDSGLVQFSQALYSVIESAGILRVPITRIKASSGAITARVDTVDVLNGAVRDIDYYLLNTTVAFVDRQVDAAIFVRIANDNAFQLQKTFGLNLTLTAGRASVGTLTPAFVNIVDDGDVSRPGQPQNVSAVALSGGYIRVSWTAPANFGAANVTSLSYRVVVTSDIQATRELSTFSTSINITGVAAKSMISVTITAQNGYFESFVSAPVLLRLGSPTPPTAPQNVQVLWRTGGAANVSWLPPFDSGGAPIMIYRVVVRAEAISTEASSTDVRTENFAVYGLKALTNYTIVVQAENYEGLFGLAAPPQSFTTRATSAPSKPPGVIVTRTTGGALYLNLVQSLDLGGLTLLQITLSATSRQFPNVFAEVYNGTSANFVFRRLTYSTDYKLKYRVTNAVVRCTRVVGCEDILSLTTYQMFPRSLLRVQASSVMCSQ